MITIERDHKTGILWCRNCNEVEDIQVEGGGMESHLFTYHGWMPMHPDKIAGYAPRPAGKCSLCKTYTIRVYYSINHPLYNHTPVSAYLCKCPTTRWPGMDHLEVRLKL